MSKKIIAAAMALVLMALVFAGCSKDKNPVIGTIGGNEYVFATDEEGNTIIDENNKVVINPTNGDGSYILDEDGEKVTAKIDLGESVIIAKNRIVTSTYILTAPEGWYIADGNYIAKDGYETNQCCIKIIYMGEREQGDGYMEYAIKEYNKNLEYEDDIEKEGYTVEQSLTEVTLHQGINAMRWDCYVDTKEDEIGYAERYYFEYDGIMYLAEYSCTSRTVYNENFDVQGFLAENLKMV